MKRKSITLINSLLLSICILFLAAVNAIGDEYDILKEMKSVKAVFDVRAGNPISVAVLLNLIHQTFKDSSIRQVTEEPKFVLVFIGPSVKLISTQTEGFSVEETEAIGQIASIILDMAKDGIELEICLAAADMFGVDPATVLPEIRRVRNGVISLIGYQAQGYSLVPIY